jgi:hypothetical protein
MERLKMLKKFLAYMEILPRFTPLMMTSSVVQWRVWVT